MYFTIYTKADCSYCNNAKILLDRLGHLYEEITIPDEATKEDVQTRIVEAGSNHLVKSVPQIFDGDTYVGGYAQLLEYIQ